MAGEADTLIQSMNQRINDLTSQLANRKEQIRRLQEKEQARRDLAVQNEALIKERDTWKAKAEATPAALQADLDEARGQLRARDHRDAWREALGGQLQDKVTVDDIWAKMTPAYQPGDQIPTAAEIREQAKAAQAAAPYLFKTPGAMPANGAAAPTPSAQPPPLMAPLAPSRGAPDTAARRFEVRKSQSRDPAWMRANQKNIEEARQAGTLAFVED